MESVSILIVIFHLQSTLLSIISFTMETISLQSCGYYCISCGYGTALWIVDIILFQAERLQNCSRDGYGIVLWIVDIILFQAVRLQKCYFGLHQGE